MPLSLRRSALLLVTALTIALVPLSANAQGGECPVDMYKPTQLAQAVLLIQRAAESPEGEEGAKALRDAARLLQDDRRFASNPVGLTFAKGQLMILWLHQEPAPVAMTAQELNLGRDRTARIDLVQAADSFLTQVESAYPECVTETARWRLAKPWNVRISAAYRLLGENKLDSADVYLREVAILDRTSPFLYNAEAQIALRRENFPVMFAKLDKAIELAALDTSLAETARQLKTQYASTLQSEAMKLTDAGERNAMLARSARMFLSIGAEAPMMIDGPAFYSAAIDIAMLTQDQELLREIVGPLLEDPTPYPDLTLLIAAENARMLNKPADAIQLYTAALDKNPNIRDANYFLAYLLFEAKRSKEMLPLVDRLMVLDPGNPDNVLMKTMAVRQIAEEEKDVAKRRTMIRDVEALMKQEAEMPQRVQITRFERRAEGGVLQGEIENRSRAAKVYTLDVSFLDAEGNVLESQTTTTDSAAAGATVSFSVTATEPGVVAWKYVLK